MPTVRLCECPILNYCICVKYGMKITGYCLLFCLGELLFWYFQVDRNKWYMLQPVDSQSLTILMWIAAVAWRLIALAHRQQLPFTNASQCSSWGFVIEYRNKSELLPLAKYMPVFLILQPHCVSPQKSFLKHHLILSKFDRGSWYLKDN